MSTRAKPTIMDSLSAGGFQLGSLAALCVALAACAGTHEQPAYPVASTIAPRQQTAPLPLAAAVSPAAERVIIAAPAPASQAAPVLAPAPDSETNTQAQVPAAAPALAAFTPTDSPLLTAYPRGPQGKAPPVEPSLYRGYRRDTSWNRPVYYGSFNSCGSYYGCGPYYGPGAYGYGYGYRYPGYYGSAYPGLYGYGYGRPIVFGSVYGRGWGHHSGGHYGSHHHHRARR